MSARAVWPAALLLLTAATAREVVRLGYFTEAQPFEVACARGWFEAADLDIEVVCLPQSAGVGAVSKIDDGDLEISLLGSTPAAAAIARGVKLKNYYVAHLKGESQALLVRPDIISPANLEGKTIGTPFGSTAHFYSTYIPVVSGVEFNLVDCNDECPGLYDAGEIDGAFVWGPRMAALKARGANILFTARLLGEWGRETFNTISVSQDFAARRPDVIERIAGVVARLDEDYLDAESTRWGTDDAAGFMASVTTAIGDDPTSHDSRQMSADNLALFQFIEPREMLNSTFLAGGTANDLRKTAEFILEIGRIASVVPDGVDDVDAFYVATTTANYLSNGLENVPAAILDEPDRINVTRFQVGGDSTCSGTVDMTARTGTLTDGSTYSYSDNLDCEWRIASDGIVELRFERFRVWTGDVVEVFDVDGGLVAKIHGFDRAWPPLRTSGAMLVKFTTDAIAERAFNYPLRDGWNATYSAASSCDEAYCGDHGTCDTASGLCTCDPGWGGADCSLASCLGTTTSGEFRSSPTAPDRDAPYPNGAECHFVADLGTDYVSFTITYDVEPTFDFVTVKSGGETWARLSGEDTATIVVPTTDGKAELAFTSDSQGRRGGFSATYVGTDDGCGEDGLCGGHGTCVSGKGCVCAEGYGGLSCTVPHCLHQALPLADGAKMISQAPGEPLPLEAACAWSFEPDADSRIRLVIDRFDIEPYDATIGKGDRVRITSSADEEFLTLNADNRLRIISSTGRGEVLPLDNSGGITREFDGTNITVTLLTDRSDPPNITYDGFAATAHSVSACPEANRHCENVGFECRGPPGSGEAEYCYDSNVAFDCTCDIDAFVPSSSKKRSRDKEWLMPLAYTCAVVAGLFLLALCCVAVRRLRKALLRKQELEANNAKTVRDQVKEAIESVQDFSAPLMLVRASAFAARDDLPEHEALRDAGQLLVLDRLEDVSEYSWSQTRERAIVFFSHQWLGDTQADPEAIQFGVMKKALISVAATAKLQLADLYVWADLCSIPQRNPGVKSLSIQSLPSYAGASDFFVAVVPDAMHSDSRVLCTKETYLHRAWCRAEILAFFVRRGPAHMYFATGDGVLEQMAPDRSSMDSGASEGTILPSAERGSGRRGSFSRVLPPDFLDFVDVFHGDLTCCRLGHYGGQGTCDKERLVKPMLGLLLELYRDRDTDAAARVMFREIEPQLKRLYPATFEYNDGDGNTKTLPLFGELVEAAFYYSDRAEADDSLPKQTPKFAPGANGARMARAPTGLELKEVMRQHGTSAGGQSLRSRPSRRLSFAGVAEPGDGFDDGRRLAETRTQKHRRANLPRRTSAFSSRHDDNV